MRSGLLLVVVACSGRPLVATDAHPAVARSPEATAAAVETAAHDAIARLAREPLSGVVLVAERAPLYASAATARAGGVAARVDEPIAMRVIADHGDVVELSTEHVEDCFRSFGESFELTVFVPRASLVPRSTAAIVHTYPDGTGYAIDRGAAVAMTKRGLEWTEPLLVATGVAPSSTNLAYVARPAVTALPSAASERLVCETYPQTLEQWRADRARRLAEERATNGDRTGELAGSMQQSRHPPWCGISRDDIYEGYNKTRERPRPLLDGKPIEVRGVFANELAVHHGAGYLGDLEARCGRVRVIADAVREGSRGGGGRAGGGGRRWRAMPGPVTWPDGSAAGRFVRGPARYRDSDLEAHGDSMCVKVESVVDRVCHRRADLVQDP